MKYEFTAEMEDGETFTAMADSRDIRRWEAMFKGSFIGDVTITKLTQLAYIALRRTDQLGGRYPTWELFDDKCIELTRHMPEDETESEVLADPTPPEATADSSAS